MNFFSRMKIGAKLSFGFGSIAFLIVAIAVFSLGRLQEIKEITYLQDTTRTQKLERLYIAREALGQTGLAARNAFIFSEDASAKKELDILDQQKATYLKTLEELTPLFKGNADFEKVRTGLLRMAEELKRPRQYRDVGKLQEYGEFLVKECSPLRRQIVTDIDVVLKDIQQEVDTRSSNLKTELSHAFNIILTVSAIALLLSTIIGVLLTRGLVKQLGGDPTEVNDIASRIANGDLSVDVITAEGDRSSTMHAMKEMRQSLIDIVGDVRAGTDTIASVSTEIANGNMALSSRTEQQAGALEETASSMEELTSTVKQNAENALQANQLAQSASEVAAKGGEVVAQVVSTMTAINDSSKKIVDIISVIDGIAFQTNILALNAAVEAARAGEQGKGFAVVATEVRSLAQRSSAAAKEIKTLISDSVEKVDLGSKLVNQAGTTMDEVVNSVRHVTDIMGEISAASREQSAGIEQVNHAVTQMDQTTQENAALVEEAAAAAQSLQEQANSLLQRVSVFKLSASEILSVAPISAVTASVKKSALVHKLSNRAAASVKSTGTVAKVSLNRRQPKRAINTGTNVATNAVTNPTGDWEEF